MNDQLHRLLPFHVTGSGRMTAPRTWLFAVLVAIGNGLCAAIVAGMITAAIILVSGWLA